MRTSILTRSAMAVASLAIGSVALAAAPANADTSDVTRADIIQVLGGSNSPATQALVDKVCDATPSTGRDVEVTFTQFNGSDEGNVAGFLVQARLETGSTARSCTFAAFALIEAYTTLSGTANITLSNPPVINDENRVAAAPSHDYTLSGDFYVTEPVTDIGYSDYAVASATGDLVTVQAATTTSKRVSNPKSTKVKNAALRTYKRTVAKAKKKLAKSLDKAGSSSSKKSAARATYKARKKAAKAKLHIAWSSDKKTIVTKVPTKTTRTPFSISTDYRDRL